MGSILVPGYLRWDGFKYVLDPTVEIVGPPGPPGPVTPGPPGPAGPAGASGNAVLVWQPGGVSAGSIFASWTALMAQRATTPDIPMTIVVDTSVQSFPSIDVGTWNLTSNTAVVSYLEGQQVPFNIPLGGIIQNPSMFKDLTVSAISMDTASITQTVAQIGLDLIDTTFGSAGIMNVTIYNGQINFFGNSSMVSASVNWIDGGHSGNVGFNLYDSSAIPSNLLHFTTANAFININSYNASFDPTTNTVTSVNGVNASFAGSATTGNVLTISGNNTANWQTPSSFTAGGDLIGSSVNQLVINLTGSGVSPITGSGAILTMSAHETYWGVVGTQIQSFNTSATAVGTGSFQTIMSIPGSVFSIGADMAISILGVDNASNTGVYRADFLFTVVFTSPGVINMIIPTTPFSGVNERSNGTIAATTSQITLTSNDILVQVAVPSSVSVNWSIIGQIQVRP